MIGYRIAQTAFSQSGCLKKGWEISDIERATIEKFARRTTQVEAEAQAKGIADADAKGKLGAKTREKKDKGAREVLEEKGFASAQTVEHLLRNEKLHPELKDQVIWIDEASLLDVRSMNALFDIAKTQNCRVVLSGDTKQHSSPRRGEAMRLLENEAGLNIARVQEVQRQKGRYKRDVELVSLGNEVIDEKTGLTGMLAGWDLLDRMGKKAL